MLQKSWSSLVIYLLRCSLYVSRLDTFLLWASRQFKSDAQLWVSVDWQKISMDHGMITSSIFKRGVPLSVLVGFLSRLSWKHRLEWVINVGIGLLSLVGSSKSVLFNNLFLKKKLLVLDTKIRSLVASFLRIKSLGFVSSRSFHQVQWLN